MRHLLSLLTLLAALHAQEPTFTWHEQGDTAAALELQLAPTLPLDTRSPRAVAAWTVGLFGSERAGRDALRWRLHTLLLEALAAGEARCLGEELRSVPDAGLRHLAEELRLEVLPARLERVEGDACVFVAEQEYRLFEGGPLPSERWQVLTRLRLAERPGGWRLIGLERGERDVTGTIRWRDAAGLLADWQRRSRAAPPAPPEPPTEAGPEGQVRTLYGWLLPLRRSLARRLEAEVYGALCAQLEEVLGAELRAPAETPVASPEDGPWRFERQAQRVIFSRGEGPRLAVELTDGRIARCGRWQDGRLRALPWWKLP